MGAESSLGENLYFKSGAVQPEVSSDWLELVTASKASSQKVWTSFAIMINMFPFLEQPQ